MVKTLIHRVLALSSNYYETVKGLNQLTKRLKKIAYPTGFLKGIIKNIVDKFYGPKTTVSGYSIQIFIITHNSVNKSKITFY